MPSLSARRCGSGAKRLAVFSLVVLLSGAVAPLVAAALDLPLTGDSVSLRAGASVRLPLSSEALGWLPGLSRILTVSHPAAPYPVSAGLSKDGSGLFLAVPPTMPPGRYEVRISALAAGGAEVTGTVILTVAATSPTAQDAPPPVVLVNGFSVTALTTGECPLSEDTTETFGRLEEFLVADGRPVVFFDNCRFGVPAIEVLGQELSNVIALLQGDNSEPVPVDVIGFSMGALVVRSYLAGKQTEPGAFSPLADPLVRKTILVAAENFGAPLAGSAASGGEQIPQLRVGSRFLWDLATWHQGLDDLRETDALAILGTGARDASGDGVAPALGASISASAFFGIPPERTRILRVCHNAPAAFFCSAREVIMAVDSEDHPTAQIIRSFLASTGTSASSGEEPVWRQIGETPSDNPLLSQNAGVNVVVKDATDQWAGNVQSVVASDPDGMSADLPFRLSADGVFVHEQLPAADYLLRVTTDDGESTLEASILPWGYSTFVVKPGPWIAGVAPAAGPRATLSLAADSLISIFGAALASGVDEVEEFPIPTELAGAMVLADGQPIPLLFASGRQINAVLPADLDGLIDLTVRNEMGEHTIRILLDDAVPTIFSRNNRGFGPAAATDAVTGKLLDPENPTAPGLLVSLFATGLGATEESKGFQVTTIKPTVYVAGIKSRVQFSGKAPGFEGLNQVNIEIPEGVPGGGPAAVVLQSGNRMSNEVTLPIE